LRLPRVRRRRRGRRGRVRRALRLDRRARQRRRRPVPSREVLARWAEAPRELPGDVILYPAIDILDGKAVRLIEGRFDEQTVYHDDPLAAAKSWVEAGARFLHVVDLDGAR